MCIWSNDARYILTALSEVIVQFWFHPALCTSYSITTYATTLVSVDFIEAWLNWSCENPLLMSREPDRSWLLLHKVKWTLLSVCVETRYNRVDVFRRFLLQFVGRGPPWRWNCRSSYLFYTSPQGSRHWPTWRRTLLLVSEPLLQANHREKKKRFSCKTPEVKIPKPFKRVIVPMELIFFQKKKKKSDNPATAGNLGARERCLWQ